MAGLLDGVLPWAYSQGDWAKRALGGLFSDPVGTFQQALGGANDRAGGLLGMTRAAANEGLNYGPATQALAGSLASAYNPVGMTVWHGSPHAFAAFDASKIGSGEGAQVYGHGLYLAQNPDVAQQYANNVKDMGAIQNINAELSRLANVMSADEIPGSYRSYRTDAGRQAAAQYDALMAQRDGVRTAPGNMYKVDLPDEQIAKMLDWDKPINEQPNVLRVVGSDPVMGEVYDHVNRFHGGDTGTFYDMLANTFGGPAKAAQQLANAGIPGIRYLDGGSRGAGQGTSNFVVFPQTQNALSILERNGTPIR